MDPNACLRELMVALNCDDREGVWERATALLAWLNRGGFEPAWPLGWCDEDESPTVALRALVDAAEAWLVPA